MKVTKLVHSCLLVEKDEKKILVDPGAYSWQDQAVKDVDYSNIDTVAITHIHPDHLNEDFARAVHKASPDATWYGTQEIVTALEKMGISANSDSKSEDVRFIESEHADLSPWFDQQPQHTSYVLFRELLVSGDCQTLTSSHGARMLAGAINGGPWGAVVGFSKMIEDMEDRPQVVLPIHDWHWNDDARKAVYDKLPDVMSKFGVKFVPLENCTPQEL